MGIYLLEKQQLLCWAFVKVNFGSSLSVGGALVNEVLYIPVYFVWQNSVVDSSVQLLSHV